MFTHKRSDFPEGFVFGAATASHQIEGGWTDGRGPSIWDTFASTPGNIAGNDTGAIAVDHYHRWPEDLDLLRDAGFDAYRFSIAWPRLIPEGTGAVNQHGIDFYDRLIDGMLERGIKPFATLYHWDLPSALQDRGGWMNRDIALWLADYAALVQRQYGDRLHAISTVNEPWCVAFLSHFLGEHAPGYRDLRATARAMHHVLFAHGSAVKALRAEGAKKLGIVLNLQKCEPATPSEPDKLATHLFDGIFNRWYLDGVFKGRYPDDLTSLLAGYLPKGFEDDMKTVAAPLDWLGVNYYSRSLLAYDPATPAFPVKAIEGPLEKTEMGWEIYPKGMTDLLVRVSRDYTKLPIYITE
ncbi:MAG: family 1 glycosylhydrolase, partial [Cucumibacter sp.]